MHVPFCIRLIHKRKEGGLRVPSLWRAASFIRGAFAPNGRLGSLVASSIVLGASHYANLSRGALWAPLMGRCLHLWRVGSKKGAVYQKGSLGQVEHLWRRGSLRRVAPLRAWAPIFNQFFAPRLSWRLHYVAPRLFWCLLLWVPLSLVPLWSVHIHCC